MAEAKNIDGLIAQDMAAQASPEPEQAPVPEVSAPVSQESQPAPEHAESAQSAEMPVQEPVQPAPDSQPEPVQASDSPIDEYGNPVEKPKMYSEDEVQRMIRERLARGRHSETPPPAQPQQPQRTENQTDEDWENQLNDFIDRRVEQREKSISEKQWQAQQNQIQADFEAKFSAGMNKYQDFHQVVQGKPITDAMMLASRALENPAAFWYGASKMHAQELDRIARMPDQTAQATAVGMLHERMVKERKVVSMAPKPLETPKGDMTAGRKNMPSLEDRIRQHAAQKRR